MTALLLALSWALPLAAAWGLLARAEPGRPATPVELALRAGLALLLAAGGASLPAWLWLLAGGGLGPGYAVADGLLFGALAAWLLWPRRPARSEAAAPSAPPAAPSPERPPAARRLDAVATAAAALGLALFAATFVREASAAPHGDWDAWAIWNLHARFLFRAGADWQLVLDPALTFSHTDYPLLIPAAVARAWAYAGETTAAPLALAGVFAAAPVLVLFGGVGRVAGPVAGAVAALLLCGTAEWLTWATAQDADLPVGALFLGALSLVAVVERAAAEARPVREAPLLALAGAAAGLGAWTKDEGVVFAGLLAVAVVARGLLAGPTRLAALRRLGAFAAGAALPLAVRLHFQVELATGMAVAFQGGGGAGGALGRALDPARWATILELALPHLPGRAAGLPLAALAAPLLLRVGAGAGAGWRELRAAGPLAAGVALAYAVYFAAWAVTPLDLAWHVRTSAPRVLLQPWPAALFVLVALGAGPRRGSGAEPVLQPGQGVDGRAR